MRPVATIMLNATLDHSNVHNVLYCGLLVTQWNAISQRYFSSWNPWSWKTRITPIGDSRNRKGAPIFMRHWSKKAHFIVCKLTVFVTKTFGDFVKMTRVSSHSSQIESFGKEPDSSRSLTRITLSPAFRICFLTRFEYFVFNSLQINYNAISME